MKIIIGRDAIGRPLRVKDESGRVYGRLTVLKLSRRAWGKSGAWWRCRCSCGRETTVRGALLRNGQTTSCGCYWQELKKAGTHRLPPGEASIRRAIGRAKYGASRRGLPWTLTDQETRQLLKSPCHYCGCPPANFMRGINGDFAWNGIDQKIPRGGYSSENCVPCCIACNRLKNDTPYDLFLSRCLRIALTVSSHPQMRQVTIPLLAEFQRLVPVLYEDIVPESRQVDNIAKGR